jgi:hypothetical protein
MVVSLAKTSLRYIRWRTTESRRFPIKDWNELEEVTWQSSDMGLFASTHRGQNSILLCIYLQGRAFVLWENRGALGCGPSPDGRRIVMFGQILNQYVDDGELLSLISNPWLRYWLPRLQ